MRPETELEKLWPSNTRCRGRHPPPAGWILCMWVRLPRWSCSWDVICGRDTGVPSPPGWESRQDLAAAVWKLLVKCSAWKGCILRDGAGKSFSMCQKGKKGKIRWEELYPWQLRRKNFYPKCLLRLFIIIIYGFLSTFVRVESCICSCEGKLGGTPVGALMSTR